MTPRAPTLPWVELSTTTVVDPAIDQSKLPRGHRPREVIVVDLIDSAGLHWRRWGLDPAVLMDTPDLVNDEAG